jgi:hypothetical protein
MIKIFKQNNSNHLEHPINNFVDFGASLGVTSSTHDVVRASCQKLHIVLTFFQIEVSESISLYLQNLIQLNTKVQNLLNSNNRSSIVSVFILEIRNSEAEMFPKQNSPICRFAAKPFIAY